jgi:DNA-binding NtrC family response regulator
VAQQGRTSILILDLADRSCPDEHRASLSALVRECLSPGAADIHLSTALRPDMRVPSPDCVVLRPSLSTPASQVLPSVRRQWADVPVLGLLCVQHSHAAVARAFASGLDDFLLCPFRQAELSPRIDRLLAKEPLPGVPVTDPSPRDRFHVQGLVGQAECFVRQVNKIPLFANADAPVLIAGETGTGKELFARAIHYHSARNGKPFVPVNCAALPDQLFENEVFGHVRGAFTNAFSHQQGLVAEAEGGTLFLDEIDTLSPPAQTKLLRFSQDRQYRPLGSSKSVVADVRIIAATNTDLRRHVEDRRFREDLYYRLNILSLSIPPLRERLGDVPALVAHFVRQAANEAGRAPMSISPSALQRLLRYGWPGNVRELEGILQRAVVLSPSRVLEPEHLDLPLPPGRHATHATASLREAKASAVRDFERSYLMGLLAACKGNVTRAARTAGKERRALQRLLDKYGLDRRVFQEIG